MPTFWHATLILWSTFSYSLHGMHSGTLLVKTYVLFKELSVVMRQ